MTRSYKNSQRALPIMQGSPVPPEWRVPAHDWDSPPWNRWSFLHMREVTATVDVPRGTDVWDMPDGLSDVGGIACETAQGAASTYGQMLDDTYTDAALIWLDGKIIAEDYFNTMQRRTPHIGFSVSKSVVSAVAGCLIADGLMAPSQPVTEIIPELADTAWNGATVGHLLDMASGVAFDETYGSQEAEVFLLDVAAGLKPPYPWMDPDRVPQTTWDLVLSLKRVEAEHGSRFEYRSIETDLLGFVLERAGNARLSELISERLWSPMGAEEDGFFTVDRAGFPLADGGFNACLRDFARFGRLLLEDGARDGRQVIPKAWIDDIRSGDHGMANAHLTEFLPNGVYRNKFWIEDRNRPAHLSLGIFGQHIYVDPDCGLVAVKLSSWTDFLSDEGHLTHWLNGVKAVAAEHGGPA